MKYTKQGFTITVPVNEAYTVRANILKLDETMPNTYDFTLEISRSDLRQFQAIGEDEVYRMESSSINRDVADYILNIYREGFFNKIIKKYEYLICFMEFGMRNYESYIEE